MCACKLRLEIHLRPGSKNKLKYKLKYKLKHKLKYKLKYTLKHKLKYKLKYKLKHKLKYKLKYKFHSANLINLTLLNRRKWSPHMVFFYFVRNA